MKNTCLYKRLVSDENIYMAIYSLNSYINNIECLDLSDIEKLNKLRDKYDPKEISSTIIEVRKVIDDLIDMKKKHYLEAKVYFKPKKYDAKQEEVIFRPLHTTNIINHIAFVSMLNIFVYEYEGICEECNFSNKCSNEEKSCNQSSKKLTLSGLGRLLPSNFYGNRISISPEFLYKPWGKQYKQYTGEANKLFYKYYESGEYRYEVDLDIVNFFPSINPEMLFNYIINKLPVNINDEEVKLLKVVLLKLLFVKLDKIQLSKSDKHINKLYYDGNKFPCDNGIYFAQGIPQGLPQSYFFANIMMIEIAKQFESVFKGKSLYYVDDSVIFTNELRGTDEDFEYKLFQINNKISEINKMYYENIDKSYVEEYDKDLFEFTKNMRYSIKVHENEKSSFTNISETNSGERYLKSISRQTSKVSFDLNTNYSDEEDIILKNRLITLSKVIDDEINAITSDNPQQKNYKKKLIRYKKYFKYREMILKFREDNNLDEVYDSLEIKNENISLEKFFELYNEDVLASTIAFIINVDNETSENILQLKKYLNKLNKALFKENNTITSYIYKVYEYKIDNKKKFDMDNISKYDSLYRMIKNKIPSFYKTYETHKEKYIKGDLFPKIKNDFEALKTRILSINLKEKFDFCKAVSLVDSNSDSVKRDILNCIFSYIFDIEVSNSYNLFKNGRRLLSYRELRILIYVRNKNFKFKEFINKIDEFSNDENLLIIDYNILEVLDYFKIFVKYPDNIDALIRVHKFVCDIWKNGSKNLYFYTLHNQEHAVVLIKKSVEFIKAISFIQISKIDYYILFLACYLHDISMVTLPPKDEFLKSDITTNKLYSDFIKDINEIKLCDSKNVKSVMKKYYNELDNYYENLVRSNHSKNSAKEIRYREELNFIETSLRDIIAEVAEAHGHNIFEVYKSRSDASNKLVSKKYMKIILRMADLLDMSNYRISKPILNNNLDNMSEVSSFHWLSHIITKDCNIQVEYKNLKEDIYSYLKEKSIVEKVTLKIRVNLSQFSKEKPKKCNKVKIEPKGVSKCKVKLKCGEPCSGEECNFLCKWLVTKNYYLFEELDSLQTYLNNNTDNYFKSELYVEVLVEDKTKLTAKEFEVISNYMNG